MKEDKVIIVNESQVQIYQAKDSDYLNLVHLALAYTQDEDNAAQTVSNWLRTRNTMDFLAEWEKLYSDGQFVEAAYAQHAADSSKGTFSMSAQKWVDTTHAVGIIVRRGRSGGVYAHEDIALEFSTWLNPLFKLYVVKEFQRLKQEESRRNSQDWQLKRLLSKANFRILTDSVKATLVDTLPNTLVGQQRKWKESLIYATEADLVNKVVFGKTAAEWRSENPDAPSGTNIRDFASAEQLVVLSNIESLGSVLLNQGNLNPRQRFEFLADQAATMFVALSGTATLNKLRGALTPLQGITSPAPEALPAAKPKEIGGSLPADSNKAPDAIPAPPIIKKLPSLRDLKPPTTE